MQPHRTPPSWSDAWTVPSVWFLSFFYFFSLFLSFFPSLLSWEKSPQIFVFEPECYLSIYLSLFIILLPLSTYLFIFILCIFINLFGQSLSLLLFLSVSQSLCLSFSHSFHSCFLKVCFLPSSFNFLIFLSFTLHIFQLPTFVSPPMYHSTLLAIFFSTFLFNLLLFYYLPIYLFILSGSYTPPLLPPLHRLQNFHFST